MKKVIQTQWIEKGLMMGILCSLLVKGIQLTVAWSEGAAILVYTWLFI